ncbi:unnamed protein product [Nezara viridula]|uniref:Uncharacterized protein n=1 Tax=Nezara viridula TaxID=85310 RepID=A0A9P0EB47_NEZVI|nr:unnamed protein product [Nezara viridula]
MLQELVPVGEVERNWRGVLIALVVILFVLGLILVSTLALSPPDRGPRATLPKVSLRNITTGAFFWKNNASWISDYEVSYRDARGGISIFNIENDTTYQFITNSTFRMLNAVDFRISSDKRFIVFISDIRKEYSHRSDALYTIMEKESATRHAVGPKDTNFEETTYRIQRFQFTPTGNAYAFIHHNDLYYCNSSFSRNPSRITNSLSAKVTNGIPDWLYQEEIFKDDVAFWFSPDSSHLAYASFDDTLVSEVSIPTYVSQAQEGVVTIPYPKPGTPNPIVTLFVVHLKNSNFPKIQLSSPKSFQTAHGYLLKVHWASDKQLDVVWMSRGQNSSIYMTCIAPDFNCTKTYFEKGSGEDDLVPLNPRQWRWSLVPLSLHGVFDSYMYFEASPPGRPSERHLYRTLENKNNEECLTCPVNKTEKNTTWPPFRTEQCIFTKSTFSLLGKFYMLECLGPEVPSVHIIDTATNIKLFTFEDNRHLRVKYDSLSIPQTKIFQIETDEGHKASVKLQMPAGLRTNEEMTFPLVVKLSYKPGEVCVTHKWQVDFSTYLASKKNFLVLEIQPSSRKHEIKDHIAVIRYITEMDFVDPSKVSILAYGYGGYLAPKLLSEKPKMFKSIAILSGIFSWPNYNSFWSERYSLDDDVTYAARDLKGHDLLLLHGTLDLSAHYHQAMIFSKALIEAGILYSHLAYPDVGGDLKGSEEHAYSALEDFFDRTLSPIDYTEWETGSTYFSFRN